MKATSLLCITFICAIFHSDAAPPIESTGLFLTKYKVDINNILYNKRILINYANCLLEKGPCTVEASELKKIIPNALATQCAECNLEEKQAVGKIFAHLLQDHRELWNQLLDKYDPDGTFRKQYELDDEDYDYEEENGKAN